MIANEFPNWSPSLKAMITDGETPPVARPIYALPVDHRWPRTKGVTLLGDAAHLMIPSGEGANLAMFDGAELARKIVERPENVDAALTDFESEMYERSTKEAQDANEGIQILFGPESPQTLVDFFQGAKSRT